MTDDSVITPRPKAGVVTRLKMNLRSPSPDVDWVSDSPYTSSNLRTDGQPKVGRGLPSIDDKTDRQENSCLSLLFFIIKKELIISALLILESGRLEITDFLCQFSLVFFHKKTQAFFTAFTHCRVANGANVIRRQCRTSELKHID